MKKNLLKTLLVAVGLCVGSMSAWSQTTTYDFEDGNARFTAYNSSKITVSTIADPRDETKKVAKFAYKAKGAHNFAYLNFSDLAENAATVRVEFDFYVTTASGHDLISLSDANFHTGALAGFDSNSNTGYGSFGTIFDLGCYRASGANYFVVNNTKADGTYTFLDQWCHADITVNNVAKTVSYTITNASSEEVTAADVSLYNRFAGRCTQIDVYMGATSSSTPIYLDNLSITPTVSSSYGYTVNAVSGGTTLKLLADGVATTGENYSVSNLPKVIKYSDQYYVLDDNTVTGYTTQSYTMGSAKETKEINYTLDETIAYYIEGETTFGQTKLSSSCSEGAYSEYAKATTTSTTIASAGFYRMETYVAGRGAYKLFVYDSSDEEITRIAPGVGAFTGEANSGVFKLAASSTIKVGAKSENSLSFDYIIIRKVGDIVSEATYYMKNKATGAYFAAGLNYGTKGMTNTIGHSFTLIEQTDGYQIDTQIFNNASNHFLNGVWTDGAANSWRFLSDGAGYYTINNGSGNLTAGAVGAELSIAAGTADNAKWQLLSESAWKAEQVARLDAATANNGVDATFYIPAANFNRNDNTENAKWQGSPTINGLGDAACNYNGEKFTNPYATFDVYQALTGLKPGAYKLTVQGFYRNGLDNASDANDNLAILYANSSEVPLVNININEFADDSHSAQGFTTAKSGYYIPDSQSDAGLAFNAGYYTNTLYVVVDADGALRIGVKKTAAIGADRDWAVFDNFQLTYYGTTEPIEVTSACYATHVSNYALDFSGVAGLTAYTASYDGTTVTLTPVTNVPANTGVVLKGDEDTYNIPVTASSSTAKGDLEGSATSATAYDAVAGYDLYILALNGVGDVQFTKATSGSIAAGKAYLKVAQSGGAPAFFNVVFADMETTGINDVRSKMADVRGDIFDLQGRKVANPTKGLYIVNGKKVMVK